MSDKVLMTATYLFSIIKKKCLRVEKNNQENMIKNVLLRKIKEKTRIKSIMKKINKSKNTGGERKKRHDFMMLLTAYIR